MTANRLHFAFSPISTNAHRDPNLLMGSDAFVLFIGLTNEANEFRTDGSVTHRDIRMVCAARGWSEAVSADALSELKRTGRLIADGDSYRLDPFYGLDRKSRDAAAARQKRYRERKKGVRHVTDHAVTRDVTVTDQRREEEKRERGQSPEVRTDVDQICSAFAQSLAARGEKASIKPAWRDSVRLLLDKDGRELREVLEVIEFVTFDEFWKANVLSLPKLREKFGTLRLQRQRVKTPKPRRHLADVADAMEESGFSSESPLLRSAAV